MNRTRMKTIPTTAGRSRNSGSALLAVVVYLIIVGILGAAFFVTVNRALDSAHYDENRVICRALADGGIERTLARLRSDSAYRGERDVLLGEGSFSTSVEPVAGDTYRIVSTGRLDTRAHLTVEAEAVVANGRVVGLRRLGETAR